MANKVLNSVRGFMVIAAISALSGCPLMKEKAAESTTDTSGGGGGGTTAPAYGMDCSSSWGADNVTTYPVSYLDSINGSAVTSVKLYLYLSGVASTNFSGTVTMTVYTCGSSSSLGANVATATYSGSLNGYEAAKTFDFSSSPITIPTNCAAGESPLSFKLTKVSYGGYDLWAGVNRSSASCFLTRSASSTALVPSAFSLRAVVTATP